MPLGVLEKSRPAISILDFDPLKFREILREKLTEKGVQRAYIFGSFSTGTCTAWSDLDVIAVKPTDQPFIERPREFFNLHELGIAIDLLVYTPEEFARMQTDTSAFWKNFRQQKIRIL